MLCIYLQSALTTSAAAAWKTDFRVSALRMCEDLSFRSLSCSTRIYVAHHRAHFGRGSMELAEDIRGMQLIKALHSLNRKDTSTFWGPTLTSLRFCARACCTTRS